jgi:hypothetical protein
VGNDPVNSVDPTGETGKLINAAIKLFKHGGNPKKAGKEFVADIVDAGTELLDGDLTVDDAVAVFNLVSPVSTKEISAGVDAIKKVRKAPKVNRASSAKKSLLLKKQLASKSQVADLANGGGKVLGQPAKSAQRVASQYGIDAQDVQKVSSRSESFSDGTSIETHAFRNANTNELFETKTIIKQ